MMNLRPFLLAFAALPLVAAADEPPSRIRMNQLGFLPDGVKRAVVPNASPRPLPWRVTDGTRTLASGRTQVFGRDSWSGEHVHRIDFTRTSARGPNYVLEVGGQTSRPFSIKTALYDRLPYDALAYFYHNRAGTPIDARFAGDAWARPAGHLDRKSVV